MDKRELFEVKDDEEQKAKLQDICDILMAAGYFRARLKGLSAFDKVVGGMVWCLEMGAIDIDVNFLFRENLNIGEKIEITEKIINVLISVKCPYALEPHQIQGLDTVKILPVVQWLVKKAMETREMLSDHLTAVGVHQYKKSFGNHVKRKPLENMHHLKQQNLPQRKFKKKGGLPLVMGQKEVLCTLMEYEHFSNRRFDDGDILSSQVENLEITERPAEKKLENRAIAQCVSSLIYQQAPLISQAIEDYTSKQAEREAERDELVYLQKQKESLSQDVHRLVARKEEGQGMLEQLKLNWKELRLTEKEIKQRENEIVSLETEENKQTIEKLDNLVARNEELNVQRKRFKIHCKALLEELQARNDQLRNAEAQPQNQEKVRQQFNSAQEQLASVLKVLGEKNVTLSKLWRQLDAVPGNSELNQYHRRFTELCGQVNAKQTELNGYYLLYNSLEDTKVYLNKELSLLTSIHDNFTQSIHNSASKSEFLQQMENIVAAVHQNKAKIESQIASLSIKQDNLQRCLQEHAAEEHHYREILKLLSQESHKYKHLISQLSAVSS